MSALRSLLEVYGGLDLVARQTGDPEIRRLVDGFLTFKDPTDDANWYQEIQRLFFPNEEPTEPDLISALNTITQDSRDTPLTVPQQSRLLYAVAATARVSTVASERDEPMLPRTGAGDIDSVLADALTALAPADKEGTPRIAVEAFLAQISEMFTDPEKFDQVRLFAAENDWVNAQVTNVPACITREGDVDNTRVVVVDTFCKSDEVSLNNLKAVVNPFNWNANYPDFFCNMEQIIGQPRTDGWGSVLEKVGLCPFGEPLQTRLKYLPTEPNPLEARLEYDLFDPCPPYLPGDGKVTVDRGFINMWALGSDPTALGVRVRTRKVVHITGISIIAQKALVCLLGYGTSSAEFLFGNALNPPAGAKPFLYDGTGPSSSPTDASKGSGDQSKPVNDHAVTTAYKVLTKAAQDAGLSYFNVAGKWVAGALTYDDMATHCGIVVGGFAKTPWEFLEAVNKPRHPDGTSGGASPSGGGQ